MAERSEIEWTDATWNPITGCSVVSPGCANCYAMRLAGSRLRHHPSREGLTRDTKAGPVWTGEVRLNEGWLDQPLRWRRPRRIFVCAHGDLFYEAVPDEWIDRVFAVMALSPQHTFQVLTKRSARMREYMAGSLGRIAEAVQPLRTDNNRAVGPLPNLEPGARWWPLPNVWLGISAEDQRRADERMPLLLDTPAAVRFLSAEPLLSGLDLTTICLVPKQPWSPRAAIQVNALTGRYVESGQPYRGGWDIDAPPPTGPGHRLDWVIVGGESGPGARPMHPDWVRSLRDQCQAAEVPFFFKQWGEWAAHVGAVDGWDIDDDPEISRYEHRDWLDGHWGEPYHPMWCDDVADDTVARIGKRRSGRLIDGRTWDEMPLVRHD